MEALKEMNEKDSRVQAIYLTRPPRSCRQVGRHFIKVFRLAETTPTRIGIGVYKGILSLFLFNDTYIMRKKKMTPTNVLSRAMHRVHVRTFRKQTCVPILFMYYGPLHVRIHYLLGRLYTCMPFSTDRSASKIRFVVKDKFFAVGHDRRKKTRMTSDDG